MLHLQVGRPLQHVERDRPRLVQEGHRVVLSAVGAVLKWRQTHALGRQQVTTRSAKEHPHYQTTPDTLTAIAVTGSPMFSVVACPTTTSTSNNIKHQLQQDYDKHNI